MINPIINVNFERFETHFLSYVISQNIQKIIMWKFIKNHSQNSLKMEILPYSKNNVFPLLQEWIFQNIQNPFLGIFKNGYFKSSKNDLFEILQKPKFKNTPYFYILILFQITISKYLLQYHQNIYI